MRKQVRMSMSLDDEVTITFHDDYAVSVEHSNRNRGRSKREFDNFDAGVSFFRQMIGALYLDGHR